MEKLIIQRKFKRFYAWKSKREKTKKQKEEKRKEKVNLILSSKERKKEKKKMKRNLENSVSGVMRDLQRRNECKIFMLPPPIFY